MRQLWLLLVKAHYIILFILLEGFALLWLFNTQSFHKSIFFNTTSGITNPVHKKRQNIRDFFSLKETNKQLILENARLQGQLIRYNDQADSSATKELIDSVSTSKFIIRNAKVVSNDLNRSKNYITIDKGKVHGISVDQGIISSTGIVGRVIATSKNYAICLPLINTQGRWNVQHSTSGNNGNLSWNGSNLNTATVSNIPRHVAINVGDSIVTNHYSKIFPVGEPVASVKKLSFDASGNFYQLEVELYTDFRKLNAVYIYERKDMAEIETLEQRVNE